jgi:hypothetical protein
MKKKFFDIILFVLLITLIGITIYFGVQDINTRILLREKETIIEENNKKVEDKEKEIQSVKDAISNEESTNSNYQEYSKWKTRDQSVQSLINHQKQ